MVAKITSPHSVKRALNYNEQKVLRGLANCIHAGNFLRESDKLNFHQKLNRFQDLISLNQRSSKSNTLHISLNFDPSENLAKKTLVAIAISYMERIGFGIQPYLVYEHIDSGHPHVHILTTNIKSDGARIDTFNIGRLKSEPARKDLEKEFGLVKAERRNREPESSVNKTKVQYGRSETKRSITNVLDLVIKHYNYNSIASLNAVLKTFNVIADRGREGGRIYNHKGLLFHILDSEGNKVGVPIKASSIYSRPTLPFLEQQFEKNELKRQSFRQNLKNTIDTELSKNPGNIDDLILRLKKKNIDTILRQNIVGFLYGITFIDHNHKSVFNGGDLGKQYSIASFQKRFFSFRENQSVKAGNENKTLSKYISLKKSTKSDISASQLMPVAKNQFIKTLLNVEIDEPRLLYPLMIKKRKRKRKLNL
jgi:uncharacterized protein YifE (UPF0438 family)